MYSVAVLLRNEWEEEALSVILFRAEERNTNTFLYLNSHEVLELLSYSTTKQELVVDLAKYHGLSAAYFRGAVLVFPLDSWAEYRSLPLRDSDLPQLARAGLWRE